MTLGVSKGISIDLEVRELILNSPPKAKMHRTYIVGIATGARNPSLTIVYQLAKALKNYSREIAGRSVI